MTDMPYEKYINEGGNSSTHPYYADDNERATMLGIDSSTFSNTVQFQMPQFMLNGPPTLAPGGGAEVLPAGMYNAGGMGSSWFTNNGFNPKSEDS